MVRPSSPSPFSTNFFFSAAGMVRRLPTPGDLTVRLPQKQKRSRSRATPHAAVTQRHTKLESIPGQDQEYNQTTPTQEASRNIARARAPNPSRSASTVAGVTIPMSTFIISARQIARA